MNRFNPLTPAENALAPQDVRFTETKVEPWPDGQRVRVHARITPFQKPPNLTFTIYDPQAGEAASVLIIENIDFDFVITMHIRGQRLTGEYRLEALLQYDEMGTVDQSQVLFALPEPAE